MLAPSGRPDEASSTFARKARRSDEGKIYPQVEMSRPLSLFVNAGPDTESVEGAVADVLGHPLSKLELDVGPVFRSTSFCIEWVLFCDHGLEDDCGIDFTTYSHQLQLNPLRAGQDVENFEEMYVECAMFAASRLASVLNRRVIVVGNLQQLVAVFLAGGKRSI